ncbi:NAD(P)-dependent oxidoreductase [Microbacterium sp. NPDC091313]
MPDPSIPVGFVGLGKMGTPMAARLVAAGYDVIGVDPVAAARDELTAAGGRVVSSVSEMQADIVILMLPDSDVVEKVLLVDGLADALADGAILVDMSSSAPLRTRAVSQSLRDRGLRMVDAPVSGGVRGAQNGALTIMVGGDEADVAEVAPVLERLGAMRHVGGIGAGHALKALNNLLSATHLWATSEALLVGERFGLDPAVMLEAINTSSGRSGSTEKKWPDFVLSGRYDSGFTAALMAKDVRVATALAHELGVPTTLSDLTETEWSAAAAQLGPAADHTEIAALMRRTDDAR